MIIAGKKLATFRARAFSLAELMVAIAIAMIATGIIVPSGINLIHRERLKHAATEAAGFINGVRKSAMAHSINCVIISTEEGIINTAEVPEEEKNRCTPLSFTPNGINLRSISGDNTITLSQSTGSASFNMRGILNAANNKEILINSNRISERYCVLITSPIGFVKIGTKENVSQSCKYTSLL